MTKPEAQSKPVTRSQETIVNPNNPDILSILPKVNKETNGCEVEIGKRGAIVALARTGLPFSDIQEITGVNKRTAARIVKHAEIAAMENEKCHDPLAVVNLQPYHRTGRPPKFTPTDRVYVIQLCTTNASQRRKSYSLLAKECKFPISRVWLAKILSTSGYSQHIPREKPNISKINVEKRYQFCSERVDKPVVGYWDGWIFTDEMSLLVGSHYGPIRVIRNSKEEYHPDCINRKRQGEVTIMFWGAMMYGVPLKDCPFFIWEVETQKEKEESIKILAAENRQLEEQALQLMENALKTNPELHKKMRGRPKNPFKIKKKTRSKKRKGGIDWFRYRERILKPLLYPFYQKQAIRLKSLGGSGSAIVLMEDGAGPHRATEVNNHHQGNGINKVDWPASSPDFNPIERVWNIMRQKIALYKPFPSTKEATKRVWVEVWKSIPVETTNALIAALPQTMEKCLADNGGNNFHA